MKLEKWEEKCDQCNGKGWILAKNDPNSYLWIEDEKIICPKCEGTGKLDFIEKIVGKKNI